MKANGTLKVSIISPYAESLYYVGTNLIIEQMKRPENQNKVEDFLTRLENQMLLEKGELSISEVKEQVLKINGFEGVVNEDLSVKGFTTEDFHKLKDFSFLHPNFLFTFESTESNQCYRAYIRNQELKYVEGKITFPEYS